METIKEKAIKKEQADKTAKLIAFIAGGLAIGVAAYYFIGTKSGRKSVAKISGFGQLLKAKAEDGLHAGSAVLEKAKQYKEEAKDAAKKMVKQTEGFVKEAVHKAPDISK